MITRIASVQGSGLNEFAGNAAERPVLLRDDQRGEDAGDAEHREGDLGPRAAAPPRLRHRGESGAGRRALFADAIVEHSLTHRRTLRRFAETELNCGRHADVLEMFLFLAHIVGMDAIDKPLTRKGRGAESNAAGRYEPQARVAIDDGWGAAEEELPPLATTLTPDSTRTIIARNDSPDIGFDRSINPYRGCEHGCIYCFARPTHAYLGLSPGLDFESRLFYKPDAAALLAAELSKKTYACRPIAIGTNTDPYQPVEKRLKIMRGILEVLRDFNHPVTIVTKSALIQRDIDILAAMAEKRLVAVSLSVTTLDRTLARVMEPRAATPPRRLETIRALNDAGIPTGVMAAPIIPALNDRELEQILAAARDHGARGAGYVLLRLPLELKSLFREWLETHFPEKASHVLSIVAQAHGGKTYDSSWGKRMTGTGPFAELIRIRFDLACHKLGLNRRSTRPLETGLFKPPPRVGDQLSLL
jgi:DNA repair photolyase